MILDHYDVILVSYRGPTPFERPQRQQGQHISVKLTPLGPTPFAEQIWSDRHFFFRILIAISYDLRTFGISRAFSDGIRAGNAVRDSLTVK
jgi:hypothetical protein